ncbi:MAG: ATP-binding protein [Burkholderiales bacterium]
MGSVRKISHVELFFELFADIIALSTVLYFSGGISNPFASFYLLLLTIGVMVLPARFSWPLAALVLGCYTGLIFFFEPLVHTHDPLSGRNPAFNLHTVGAWMTFVLSTLILAILVVKIMASLRERERRLAKAREESLRNERIVALGAFAAGAAHQLGTPLSTIAVIAKELERRLGGSSELDEMLRTLRAQVDVCKHTLTELTQNTSAERIESCALCPADVFLTETLNDWRETRPEATLRIYQPVVGMVPNIIAEPTLKQALINVLNNAADVSPGAIEVRAEWNDGELSVDVIDGGPGFSDHNLMRAGRATFSTKAEGQGLGIGLYLARAALERFGGSLTLANRTAGGVHAKVLIRGSY